MDGFLCQGRCFLLCQLLPSSLFSQMNFLGYILSYRHPIAFVCFHFVFGCVTLYICGFKLCLNNRSVTPPYTRRVFLYFLCAVCSDFLGNTNLGVERRKEENCREAKSVLVEFRKLFSGPSICLSRLFQHPFFPSLPMSSLPRFITVPHLSKISSIPPYMWGKL